MKIGKALASANEFNARVIESLASGVLVTQADTSTITLFSQRMEAITDLAAEDVLGRPARKASRRSRESNHALIHQTVVSTGRFPLTKIQVTSAKGRKRTVFVRAQRMYSQDGEVEGAVFVVDDVSERELFDRQLLALRLARSRHAPPRSQRASGSRRRAPRLHGPLRRHSRLHAHRRAHDSRSAPSLAE